MKSKAGVLCVSFFAFIVLYPALFILIGSLMGEEELAGNLAGILDKINDITLFLNITDESYLRFGHSKAPKYVTWSNENRSELIRIPAAFGKYKRAELRSADPMCNPYLAFALIIKAGIYGVKNNLKLPKPADFNLYLAEKEKIKDLKLLPLTLAEAKENALNSLFIKENLNENLIKNYTQD